MPSLPAVGAHVRVMGLAAQPAVHRAFQWLHCMSCVCASGSANWWQLLRLRLVRVLGLCGLQIAFARWTCMPWRLTMPATLSGGCDARRSRAGRPASAHLDTVFPAGTPIEPVEEICFFVRQALQITGSRPDCVAGPDCGPAQRGVADGDQHPVCRKHRRGSRGQSSGHAAPVSAGGCALRREPGTGGCRNGDRGDTRLGSRRFRVEVTGPGGHAWTDAGTPKPHCGAGGGHCNTWSSAAAHAPTYGH